MNLPLSDTAVFWEFQFSEILKFDYFFFCKFDLKILRTEINLKKIEIIYIIGLSNSNITIIRKYWEIQHFKFYFFYSKFEQHVISHKDYSMTGLYLIWSNSLNNFNQFFNNIV